MQHDDGLRCADVLADADVVGQGRLLATFGHVNHGYVGIVKLVQNVRLTKVQPLKTDLVKINSLVNSTTLPPVPNSNQSYDKRPHQMETPPKLPLPLGASGPPPNKWSIHTTQVHVPNSISIGSAVFLGLNVVSNRCHAISVAMHSVHVMQPVNVVQISDSKSFQ